MAIALVNALAGHALYRGLIWCLAILVLTLFLGRFFCGWICPLGTLQHFVGNLPSESKRGKHRIEANRYKRWQTGKYVVLLASLVAALFGSAAIGWLDPFSLLVRSFGLSLLLAFNAGARGSDSAGNQSCGRDQSGRRDDAHDFALYGARSSSAALHARAGAGHFVSWDADCGPAGDAAVVQGDLPARRGLGTVDFEKLTVKVSQLG
ncbi:MAG: 4Fe-4S binding protein [Terracidiphilus sp.]